MSIGVALNNADQRTSLMDGWKLLEQGPEKSDCFRFRLWWRVSRHGLLRSRWTYFLPLRPTCLSVFMLIASWAETDEIGTGVTSPRPRLRSAAMRRVPAQRSAPRLSAQPPQTVERPPVVSTWADNFGRFGPWGRNAPQHPLGDARTVWTPTPWCSNEMAGGPNVKTSTWP